MSSSAQNRGVNGPQPAQAQAPVRTPLRNISNASDHARKVAPFLQHKTIMALRGTGKSADKTTPQVCGNKINLVSSPIQVRQAGLPTRSPMAGSTPDDVRRAAKKAPISHPSQIIVWKEVVDSKTGKKYYWNTSTNETTWNRPQEPMAYQLFSDVGMQLHQHFAQALVAAKAGTMISALSSPLKNDPSPDLVKEAARIKKENDKAKREAKAALRAEQKRLQLEQQHRAAQERAAVLERQNGAVLEVLSKVSEFEEGCLLQELEPLRSVPHELISVGQSLEVIASKVYMLPLELHQIEDALRARKSVLEHENVLSDLHSTLLGIANGDVKASSSKSSNYSWTTQVKKWAFEELGENSPFVDSSLCRQKKEGALEYKHLNYAQRISLLHDLTAAAITNLLSAEEPSEQFANSLRPTPLGVDSQGRAYWHGTNPAGTACSWVLRENHEQPSQRSRLSVLSSDGTPVKGSIKDDTGSEGDETQESTLGEQTRDEMAPERGEAGDHFYWHRQWVLVMSRAARPDFYRAEAPELDLLTSDENMVCRYVPFDPIRRNLIQSCLMLHG